MDDLSKDREQLIRIAEHLNDRFPEVRSKSVDDAAIQLFVELLGLRTKVEMAKVELRATLRVLGSEIHNESLSLDDLAASVNLAVATLRLPSMAGLEEENRKLRAAMERARSELYVPPAPGGPMPEDSQSALPGGSSVRAMATPGTVGDHAKKLAEIQEVGRRVVGGVKRFTGAIRREGLGTTLDEVREKLSEASKTNGDSSNDE